MPKLDPRGLELIWRSFGLGFVSLAMQVCFARLAVGFAGGNEVYLSVFFFFWLLFTGLGALLVKKVRPPRLFIALAVLAPVGGALFFISPKVFGIPVQQLVPPHVYLFTIVFALCPICFLGGAIFSSVAFHGPGEARSSRAYWGEALGALVAGAVTALYYSLGGRDYNLLLLIVVVCLAFGIGSSVVKLAVVGLGLLVVLFGGGNALEDYLLQARYWPYSFRGSVSGRVIRYDAISTGENGSLYSGGLKVADYPDSVAGQEMFLWTYLAKPEMKDIALVGAEYGLADAFIPGHIRRLYIYPETKWRRLVPAEFLPPEANSWFADPVAFFRKTSRMFDAISITLGPLLSFHDYRLESASFFGYCRRRLANGGVLAVNLPTYDGMWRPELRQRINRIYWALKSNFPDVQFVPGWTFHFICADKLPVSIVAEEMIARLDQLAVRSAYFNEALIRERLNDFKLNLVRSQLEDNWQKVRPLDIGHGLAYYFSLFGLRYGLSHFVNLYTISVLILIVLSVVFVRQRDVERQWLRLANIFYFGTCSFAIEIIAICFLQLLGGYIYIALGVIIGLFMAGMVVGAVWGTYFRPQRKWLRMLSGSALAPIAVYILLSLVMFFMPMHQWFWMVAVALAGLAGGMGYAVSAVVFDRHPGLPYGVDLCGGMVGTVVAMALLVGSVSLTGVLTALGAGGLVLFATNWRTERAR